MDASALARSNRVLRTLSAGHRVLLRAPDEPGLLESICNVLVEDGRGRVDDVGDAQRGAEILRRSRGHLGDDAEPADEHESGRQEPEEEAVGEGAGDDPARNLDIAVDYLEGRIEPPTVAALVLRPLGEAVHSALERLAPLTQADAALCSLVTHRSSARAAARPARVALSGRKGVL